MTLCIVAWLKSRQLHRMQTTRSGTRQRCIDQLQDAKSSFGWLVQALRGNCEIWEPVHRNFFGADPLHEGSAKVLAKYIMRCGPEGLGDTIVAKALPHLPQ
jgi:hypothetical protein